MPTVDTNGVETYYERHGDGPPVVFSHGAGLDHRMWEPQVEALTDRYEVTTYDVRAHGETGIGGRSKLTVDLFVDDLHRLVRELDLDAPAVVGLSMGGMITHQYAARYPEDTGALVVAGTQTAETLTLTGRVLGEALPKAVLGVGNAFGPERAETVMEGIQSVIERFADEGASGHDEELEAMAEEANGTAEFLRVMEAFQYGYDPVALSAIDVPTLVVYGGNESAIAKTHAGHMAGGITDAEVVELADTGHVSNWDSPGQFNETLRGFLARALAD